MGIETSDAATSTKQALTIRNDLENAMERMSALTGTIERMINSRPFPEQIAGFIEKYSYGSGKQGEMPRHRMTIRCGAGITFAVDMSSSCMDEFMETVGLGDLLNGTRVNGLFVRVMLDEKNGPRPVAEVAFLGSKSTAMKDRWGQYLYIGASVSSGRKTGTVVEPGDEANTCYVDFEGDDESTLMYGTDLTLL